MMKRAIVKIGKTGKIVGAIFGLITGAFGVWTVYEKCSTKDVAGEWYIEFKVEKSSYKPYIGETHTQKVFFVQADSKVTGNGEKWKYNGELLDFSAHRKLEYDGIIKGKELKAKYLLHGRDRDSEGMIFVEISSDGKVMKGTFSGTAGTSSGSVYGEKEG